MPSENVGKITEIKRVKKKWEICFSDYAPISLHDEVYVEYYFYIGKEISKKEYEEILTREKLENGLSYAKNILSKKSYTEYEIETKLTQKNIQKDEISKIIKILKEEHFLNDADYMKEYVELRTEKNIGKYRIIEELKQKGIPSFLLATIDFSKEKEDEKLIAQLNDLWRKKASLSKRKRRDVLLESLQRNGFSYSDAMEKIKEFEKKEPEVDERAKLRKEYDKMKLYSYDNQKIYRRLRARGFSHEDILAEIKEIKDEVY